MRGQVSYVIGFLSLPVPQSRDLVLNPETLAYAPQIV